MSKKSGCACGCGCGCSGSVKEYTTEGMNDVLTLANLPIGSQATIEKVLPELRGRKKFADVGLVPGTSLMMEAHAPFGGLLRVRVMETSMALHRDDAVNIILQAEA